MGTHSLCLLSPLVKDADLSIRDTSAEAGLEVWLVLIVPVIQGGAAAHGNTRIFSGLLKGKSVCKFFDDGYSTWYEVITHCSFDFHFSNK